MNSPVLMLIEGLAAGLAFWCFRVSTVGPRRRHQPVFPKSPQLAVEDPLKAPDPSDMDAALRLERRVETDCQKPEKPGMSDIMSYMRCIAGLTPGIEVSDRIDRLRVRRKGRGGKEIYIRGGLYYLEDEDIRCEGWFQRYETPEKLIWDAVNLPMPSQRRDQAEGSGEPKTGPVFQAVDGVIRRVPASSEPN